MSPSPRTRVKRGAKRASYDEAVIHQILDDCLICHVGFTVAGEARVIPTAFLRIGNAIYLHGNRRNQMLNALLDGQSACISVMLLDGLVLARSGMHTSANYRSVVLFGKATEAEDKLACLNAFVDRLAPGRSADVRAPSKKELAATLVIRIEIDDASAKVRTGPPVDDDADYGLDVWAGVLPVHSGLGAPEPCPRLSADTGLPDYIKTALSVPAAPLPDAASR